MSSLRAPSLHRLSLRPSLSGRCHTSSHLPRSRRQHLPAPDERLDDVLPGLTNSAAARVQLSSTPLAAAGQVSGAVCGEMLVTVAVGAAMAGGDIDEFSVLTFTTMGVGLLVCAGLAFALRSAAAVVPPAAIELALGDGEEQEGLISPSAGISPG